MTATPMARKVAYQEIRAAMARSGVAARELAAALDDRSQPYLCAVLAGKTSPRLTECYKIMDYLGLPREDFTRYWPDDPYQRADAYMASDAPRKAGGRNR